MRAALHGKWLQIILLGVGLFVLLSLLFAIPQLFSQGNPGSQRAICHGTNCGISAGSWDLGVPWSALIYNGELLVNWWYLVLDLGLWILVAIPVIWGWTVWRRSRGRE